MKPLPPIGANHSRPVTRTGWARGATRYGIGCRGGQSEQRGWEEQTGKARMQRTCAAAHMSYREDFEWLGDFPM